MRRCEIQVGTGWVEKPFKELKRGDRFRLFEESGVKYLGEDVESLVVDENGNTCWLAESDAYQNEQGVWTITIVSFQEK